MSSTPSRTPTQLPSQKPAPSAPDMASNVPGPSATPSQLGKTITPSQLPSKLPSQAPSKLPSQSPSKPPSKPPSQAPSKAPSKAPSLAFGSRRPGQMTSAAPPGFGAAALASGSGQSSSMPPPPPPASARTATPSEATSTVRPARQTKTPAAPSLAGTFHGVSGVPGPSSSRAAAPSPQVPGRSMIPRPGGGVLASTYTAPEDLERAGRQLDYARLSRAQKDEQDRWAAAKGTELAPCPANWGWLRWNRHPTAAGEYPGYVCEGGLHYIPDILVAEGVPGLYSAARPPRDLIEEMRVLPEERHIPPGYWGPVRPLCQKAGRWIYPRWA